MGYCRAGESGAGEILTDVLAPWSYLEARAEVIKIDVSAPQLYLEAAAEAVTIDVLTLR